MVVEKLPVVVPPFGRVPGRGLLVLPILEARRRQNRGEIAKKGSRLGGFASQRIYGQRGAASGATRGLGAPSARPDPRPRQVASWVLGGGPLAPPGDSGRFLHADIYPIFPNFWSTFNMGET